MRSGARGRAMVITALAASLLLGGIAGELYLYLQRSNGTAAPPGLCALGDNTYASPPLTGQFEKSVDMRMASLPFIRTGGAARTFQGGRQIGYLAEVAISGPDRPAEDAHSRTLHYSIGKLPLIPLQGAVVVHNPGPLEYYETHLAFSSETGARAFLDIIRHSQSTVPHLHPQDVWVGDGSVAWLSDNAGDPNTETAAYIDVVSGGTVIQLTLKGGESTSFTPLPSLATSAINNIAEACQ